MSKRKKIYRCPVCNLAYRQEKWAKKCKAWCREHNSCHLEITKHAIKEDN